MLTGINRGFAVLGVMTIALFVVAASSYADNGNMNREGRFVWHAPSKNLDPTHGKTAAPAPDSRVIYDKGDLGKYERNGRVVSRVYEGKSKAWSSSQTGNTTSWHYRVVDHYKHKHYFPVS